MYTTAEVYFRTNKVPLPIAVQPYTAIYCVMISPNTAGTGPEIRHLLNLFNHCHYYGQSYGYQLGQTAAMALPYSVNKMVNESISR